MSKKDYIAIADIFKKAIEDNKKDETANGKIGLINGLIYDFCLLFVSDNPRFNDRRFIDYINRGQDGYCELCGERLAYDEKGHPRGKCREA